MVKLFIWFRDLQISQKIIGFVVLSALLLSIVGFVGLYNNNSANTKLNAMYNENLLAIKWFYDIRTHVRANEANLLWLTNSSNPQEKQNIIKDIQDRGQKANVDIKNIEKLDMENEQKELLNEFKEKLANYRTIRENIINLNQTGRSNEARELLSKNKQIFLDMNVVLRKLAKHEEDSAEAIDKQNKISADLSNTFIISIILISLVIFLSFGIYLAHMIPTRLKIVANWLKLLAEGDLSMKDTQIRANDEIGEIGKSMNATAQNLRSLVSNVMHSVEEISSGSEQMSAAAEQTAQGAQQVAISITQLATGAQEQAGNVTKGVDNLNDIDKIVKEITTIVKTAATTAKGSTERAISGSEKAHDAIGKMSEIKNFSQEIASDIDVLGKLSNDIDVIVDLIKGIATQTNLLALNAAIEAARAGEHGKGFAVVAEEVKKLAGQSAEATDKITGMIKQIQNKTGQAVSNMQSGVQKVEEGVSMVSGVESILKELSERTNNNKKLMEKTAEDMIELSQNSDETVKMMENIASVTEESSASAEEISSITEEQTASVEEISASSQALAKIAENLQKQVSVFKI